MKKIILFLVLILLITVLISCDFSTEEYTEDKSKYYFLDLKKNNKYGGRFIKPDSAGNYVYSKNTSAEIKFEVTEGYNFSGWEGKNKDNIQEIKDEDRTWKILMNSDKELRAEFKKDKFLIIEKEFIVSEKNITDNSTKVPYNLSKIKIVFNNELGISDLANTEFSSSTEGDQNTELSVKIEENIMTLSINRNLKFSEEYTVNFKEGIWDKDGEILSGQADFSFTVEEDSYPPEAPGIPGLKIQDGNVKLIWKKSFDIPQLTENDYAYKYNIYRSQDNSNFSLIKTIEISEEQECNYIDNEVNLEDNIYYYQITALDENDNESKPSKIVSTEGK